MQNAVATITYDITYGMSSRTPAAGDFLKSISRKDNRTLQVYLIVGVHEVRRRVIAKHRRFRLKAQKGYSAMDIPNEAFVWRMHWNCRKQ